MADDVRSAPTAGREPFLHTAHHEAGAVEVGQPLVPIRFTVTTVLSYLFLLTIAVQGFHVIEHITLVVQVSALGMGLDEAHGLLGARVDFEWLHFSYNLSFLATLILLLAYGWRRAAALAKVPRSVHIALIGAVGLQSYHVAEHVIRIVQYLNSDCTPCVGLIGKVVTFTWPHLFFGLFAYIPLVVAYFAYGLHRQLGLPFVTNRRPVTGALLPPRSHLR